MHQTHLAIRFPRGSFILVQEKKRVQHFHSLGLFVQNVQRYPPSLESTVQSFVSCNPCSKSAEEVYSKDDDFSGALILHLPYIRHGVRAKVTPQWGNLDKHKSIYPLSPP